MFTRVVMMFIAPSIEEIPLRCRLKTARSTDPPECDWTPVRGMYMVHPDPIPCSTKTLARRRITAGGRSQKDTLFRRGKAISMVVSPYLTGEVRLCLRGRESLDTGCSRYA
jgi:hypothetical protein